MLGKALTTAAAGNAAGEAGAYVEEVFSTYVYEGNGSAQTITNGIDLDGEGGLVWSKGRTTTSFHQIQDTERGTGVVIFPNADNLGDFAVTNSITSFNSNGYSISNDGGLNAINEDFVSWTFRKAPKFFDVVAYTGTGSATTVSHNLGSVPGCIIVKRTDTAGDWQVYHRANTANPETDYLVLNSTAATADSNTRWNDTAPTDAVFTVGTEATVNASGGTYVAYLFAHNDGDGEFGKTADQDIIKCGSYTGNGSTDGPEIDLGFEPQFLIIKAADRSEGWWINDTMRGSTADGQAALLAPNLSGAEVNYTRFGVTSTGFKITSDQSDVNTSGQTYIYIAIRRGPMKTPESGAEVLGLNARTGTGSATVVTSGITADLAIIKNRSATNEGALWAARPLGPFYMKSSATSAETSSTTAVIPANPWDVMDGMRVGATSAATNASGNSFINYHFRRAPGFFDVVAYTGTGVARTVPHNLGVAPEMMIVKSRSAAEFWAVYHQGLNVNGDNAPETDAIFLNSTIAAVDSESDWNDTAPTSADFTVKTDNRVNASGGNYIAYLFATLPGVSKVGSYTGNGTSQTIDCGFSTGARFVLTKRVNTTGNWNVWDSERGIVAGNDPRLELNTGDAEDTGHDYIDPDSSGFIVNYVADDNDDSNVNGDEYIFLAIA